MVLIIILFIFIFYFYLFFIYLFIYFFWGGGGITSVLVHYSYTACFEQLRFEVKIKSHKYLAAIIEFSSSRK